MARDIVVGVISDTHGMIRREALAALDGVALIVHAGDVGNAGVLAALRIVAPVTAVAGNMDRMPLTASISPTEVVETDRASIYLLHDLNQLDLDPVAAGFAVVVSGHTHRPACLQEDGVLYLNPGSAGPIRGDVPPSVAVLRLPKHGVISAEIVILDG